MTNQATKIAAPATAGEMALTLKPLNQPAIVRKLRDAGTAHSNAAGKFFLTVLATYLHVGREDTLSAIRDTWADGTDAARQYATNVCRMAYTISQDGKAARLPLFRTIAEMRTLTAEIKKASLKSKEEDEAAKGGKEGTNPGNTEAEHVGSDDQRARFAVSAMASMQAALAALATISDDAIATSKNASLDADALRSALEVSGTAIAAHVAALAAMVKTAPADLKKIDAIAALKKAGKKAAPQPVAKAPRKAKGNTLPTAPVVQAQPEAVTA